MAVITPYDSFAFPNNLFTAYPNGMDISGVGIAGVIYQLSSAQLLALGATPVTLVAAPGTPPKGFGSALYLLPKRMTLQYLFGGTAYTIANADNKFQVEYVGQATSLIQANATGLVDQAANTVVTVTQQAAGNIAQANCAGLGLEVKLTGTTPALTLGNGTVVISLRYDVIVLS